MPEAAPPSDKYLDAVERRLPFGDDERAEILDELRQHLADSAAALQESGMDPIEAERAAVDRLGSAERLADELTKARRDTTRLLAAAGAGAWGAIRGVVWGGVVGLGFVLLAWLVLMAVANAAVYQLGVQLNGLDDARKQVLPILDLGIAAFVAGRVVTPSVAATAAFQGRKVRWLTIPLGAAVVLACALLGWSGPLGWPSVIALLSLPLFWIVGAWQTRPMRLGYPSRLARGLALGVGLAAAACVVTSSTFAWSAPYQSPADPVLPGQPGFEADPGWDRIAADTPAGVDAAILSPVLIPGLPDHDAVVASVVMADRGQLSTWRQLRVEAWQTVTSGGFAVVDPTEKEPVATASVQWMRGATALDGWDLSANYWQALGPGAPLLCRSSDGILLDTCPPASVVTLSGRVTVHLTRPGMVYLALTGVAPDGRRYLIGQPNGAMVAFDGTALDWLEAALAGH